MSMIFNRRKGMDCAPRMYIDRWNMGLEKHLKFRQPNDTILSPRISATSLSNWEHNPWPNLQILLLLNACPPPHPLDRAQG